MGQLYKLIKSNFQTTVLFLVGITVWALTMVKSGLIYSFGMGFWGPNGHDGIWHIALSEALARGNWAMPVFAGESIKNYHIGFDLALALLHKITFIPTVNLYFQIVPPLLAFFTGFFVYQFTFSWTKSSRSAFWATFFTYFAGSFGWIITWLRGQGFGGESMFWSQEALSSLINPPFALSLVLIFAGLCLLIKNSETGNKKYAITAAILFGVLVQIKVYGGILVLAALFFSSLSYLVLKGRLTLFRIFSGALVLSLALLLPLIEFGNNTIIWKPFWFLETMMSDPSRLYWPRFAQAMINYKLGGVFIKEILAYGVAFVIFVAGNLGIRLFSVVFFLKKGTESASNKYIEVFILTVIILGAVAPMLFIQNGTAWNTIQFFYYSLVFLGVLAGIGFSRILQTSKVIFRGGLIFAVLTLTLPTMVATLRNYLPARPPAMISKNELSALDFLAQQPGGIVLTQPFDRAASDKAADLPPRPLYLYESTAYVSALSNKAVYLEDEVNLEITRYDWKKRKEELVEVLGNDRSDYLTFLHKYNISYIYINKSSSYNINPYSIGDKVFENSQVTIFKVD